MNITTSTKTNRLTENTNNMAEVVNQLCSKDLKHKTKHAVLHYLEEKDCMDEWGSNYLSSFVIFATYVHHNSTRFPLSLIDQHERGVPCAELEFVTKAATVCFFQEIMEDITCMSATAAQHRYCIQLWLITLEPRRNFILKDIPEIMTSTKRQKKKGKMPYRKL